MNKNAIIIFIKNPEYGKVKSRLSATLNENLVLEIYKAFVEDLISLLKKTDYIFKIAYSPTESEIDIKNWLGNEYSYFSQTGKDLGEKMKNAFYEMFSEGFDNLIIIGSDSPDLESNIFSEAFLALENHSSVIGPALDGGYYLIGFNKKTFLADIFNNIEWSTNSVFETTMKIFEINNYNVYKLPEWSDIDNYEDLKELIKRCKNTDFEKSKTISLLKANNLIHNE